MFGQQNYSAPIPVSPLAQAELLKATLMSRATGGISYNEDYRQLRRCLMDNESAKQLLPSWVRTCCGLDEFWDFIKPKFASYRERRAFLSAQFEPLLGELEASDTSPLTRGTESILSVFDTEHVNVCWDRAIARRESDPEGAITAARALLETVCKHICAEFGDVSDSVLELPELYSRASRHLRLAPSQYTEEAFRRILGGCSNIVSTMANIRNRIGDAHGVEPQAVRPAPRHARLVVNLAGSMALFLIETLEARRADIPANTQN